MFKISKKSTKTVENPSVAEKSEVLQWWPYVHHTPKAPINHGAHDTTIDASTQAVRVNVRVPKETGDGRNGNNDDGDDKDTFDDVLCSAITYVMLYPHVGTFAPPSPQYLTAVYRTMTSSFPELSDQAIEVCDHTGE